jgi:hypothetical protein
MSTNGGTTISASLRPARDMACTRLPIVPLDVMLRIAL